MIWCCEGGGYTEDILGCRLGDVYEDIIRPSRRRLHSTGTLIREQDPCITKRGVALGWVAGSPPLSQPAVHQEKGHCYSNEC